MHFVGMDFRSGTVKIHERMAAGMQTGLPIVVHLAIIQSCCCVCTTVHPTTTIPHKCTLCCGYRGTIDRIQPIVPTLCDRTLQYRHLGLTPLQTHAIPSGVGHNQFFKCHVLLVLHSKTTIYRRLTFAFANKSNVATSNIQCFGFTQDVMDALFDLNCEGICFGIFFSLGKDLCQGHRFFHSGAPLWHAYEVLVHDVSPTNVKERVAAAQYR